MFKLKKKYSDYINTTSKKENDLIINNKKSINIGTDGKYKYWLTRSQIGVHSLILGDPYKRFEKNILTQYMKEESNIYLFSDDIDLTIEMLSRIPERENYKITTLDVYSTYKDRNFEAFNIFNKFFSVSRFLSFVGSDLLSDSIDGQIREQFMKVFYYFANECSNLKSYYSNINDILSIFDEEYYNKRHQNFSSSKKHLDDLNLIWNSFYKISLYEYLSKILSPYNDIFRKDGELTLQNFKPVNLNNIVIISMPKEKNVFLKRFLIDSFTIETVHHLGVPIENESLLKVIESNSQALKNNVVFFCNTPLWATGSYLSMWRAIGYSIFFSYTDIETLISNNKNKEHYYSFKANVANLFLYETSTNDLYKKDYYPKIHKPLKENEFLYLAVNKTDFSFNKVLW